MSAGVSRKGKISIVVSLLLFTLLTVALLGRNAIALTGALVLDLDNPRIYEKLSAKLLAEGQTDEALEVLTKGLKLFPDNKVLLNNMGVYLSTHQHNLASLYFQKALVYDPEYINPRMSLAVLAREASNFHEAVDQLSILVEQYPENPSFHYDLAINLVDRYRAGEGRLEDALHHFRAAHNLEENYASSVTNIRVLEAILAEVGSS